MLKLNHLTQLQVPAMAMAMAQTLAQAQAQAQAQPKAHYNLLVLRQILRQV